MLERYCYSQRIQDSKNYLEFTVFRVLYHSVLTPELFLPWKFLIKSLSSYEIQHLLKLEIDLYANCQNCVFAIPWFSKFDSDWLRPHFAFHIPFLLLSFISANSLYLYTLKPDSVPDFLNVPLASKSLKSGFNLPAWFSIQWGQEYVL